MLKTLLIALDGTRDSQPALEFGLKVAQKFGCLIVGCGVVDEPGLRLTEATLLAEGYVGARESSALLEARRRASGMLEQFEKRCSEAGVRSVAKLDIGTPHVQITAEAHRYDLVLMGCHTHFELGMRTAEDATLQHVVHETARPVIVVPSGPTPSLDGPIVAAFDGSMRASRALYDLVASHLAVGRVVHVVTVHRSHEVAARVASRAVDFLKFHEIDAVAHPFDGSFPAADAALGAVERLNGTLLVVGAFGHTPLREFFFGSTTRSVMSHAPVPVFCSR